VSLRFLKDVLCPGPIGLAYRGAIILVRGIIGFLCRMGPKPPCPVHKSAAQHRTGAMRTSENSFKAKFAEFIFHALA
jgi:hypothetical protein